MVALFSLITIGFAWVALWTGQAGQWVIAVAAAALAAWMATLAWSALRKVRS